MTSFEVEIEQIRATIQIMIPYSSIEPIQHHLTHGIGSGEGDEVVSWYDSITNNLMNAEAEAEVLLGRAELTIEQMIDLSVGDVLMVNQSQDKLHSTT